MYIKICDRLSYMWRKIFIFKYFDKSKKYNRKGLQFVRYDFIDNIG